MRQDTPRPEVSRADLHTARPAAYTQLRRAFERQLIWANDFARARRYRVRPRRPAGSGRRLRRAVGGLSP